MFAAQQSKELGFAKRELFVLHQGRVESGKKTAIKVLRKSGRQLPESRMRMIDIMAELESKTSPQSRQLEVCHQVAKMTDCVLFFHTVIEVDLW